MGALCTDRPPGLPDGQQTPPDGPQVQGLYPARQYAQAGPGAADRCFRDLFEMAGSSGRFCFLYNSIPGLGGKEFIVVLPFKSANNMTFSVQVKVMPLKELLDPQGK